MSIDLKDLTPIRVPAAALVASVIFSALLIDYADDNAAVVAERVRIAHVNANEAKRRYQDSDLEKAMISKYLNIGNCRRAGLSDPKTDSGGLMRCAPQIASWENLVCSIS